MAFNDEIIKDGRGRAIIVDASTDRFSTRLFRWADVGGLLEGSTGRQNRIISLGAVTRGLGQQRVATAGTCTLVLDNADGALDSLVGSTTMDTQAKLRLRISVVVYDPTVSPVVTTYEKQLGEFSLSTWTRQNNTTLTMELADDVMGLVAQQATLPNFLDWQAVGTTANNPIKNAMGLPNALSEYSAIQLAFGEDWVLALPHVIPWLAVDADYTSHVIVPVCVTTDTGAGSAYEIDQLRIQYIHRDEGLRLVDVPRTWEQPYGTTNTLWRAERSTTITKGGKDFKVVYLVVNNDGLDYYLSSLDYYQVVNGDGSAVEDVVFSHRYDGGYPVGAVDWAGTAYKRYSSCRVTAWYAKGFPLSARTQQSSRVQHPVDVLTDLVAYYSDNTAITVNSTEAARAKAATASAACAGVVQPWTSGPKKGDPSFQPPPSLRQTISAICQSSDVDCFIDWAGQFSFAADFWDFRIASSGSASWSPNNPNPTSGNGVTTTYLPAVIPETWLQAIERWVPSDGERWAPYNRVWFNGGRASPGDGITDVPFAGPWDFAASISSGILIASRVIEATLEQGWRPYRQQAQTPWYWRSLNTVARDMVRFRTHIGGLQLELGQYFALSWTRGTEIGSPYSGTIFQCEAITYAPGDDTVEVTAIWRNDVMTERQYVLDDETMTVRIDITITNTATTDGSLNVAFGATVDLTEAQPGDILLLRDTTQAADVFTRNGAWRILTIDITAGANALTLAVNGEGDYPAAGTVASGQWGIYRGATTYHTAVSDPTNYPLGGEQYGKVTDSSGEYSNSETGNRLISG